MEFITTIQNLDIKDFMLITKNKAKENCSIMTIQSLIKEYLKTECHTEKVQQHQRTVYNLKPNGMMALM